MFFLVLVVFFFFLMVVVLFLFLAHVSVTVIGVAGTVGHVGVKKIGMFLDPLGSSLVVLCSSQALSEGASAAACGSV